MSSERDRADGMRAVNESELTKGMLWVMLDGDNELVGEWLKHAVLQTCATGKSFHRCAEEVREEVARRIGAGEIAPAPGRTHADNKGAREE